MNKELIKEKLLNENKGKLIDILEFKGKYYAKTLINLKDSKIPFEYKYYEIVDEKINNVNEYELEEIKKFFKTNLGNVIF